MIVNRQHVFITGASSGIGRAFALELAPTAQKISLHGRDLNELKKTETAVKEINPKLMTQIIAGDLTLEADRNRICLALKNTNLDMMVLNAGGGAFGAFLNVPWSAQQKVIELNIVAPTHLTNALLPELLQTAKSSTQRSALMIVSSHAAFIRTPLFSVYGACKSYLNYLTLTLKQELRNEPLDLMVVCPGATQTAFSKRAGLPQKMLSTPKLPVDVARSSLSHLGCKTFFIVAPFDRITYLVSRFLPICVFDGLVGKMQKRLLKSHGI